MSVHFQSIHNARRGAVMIYALVFAITAAVALYVASSIYQTRVRSSWMRAYNEQRVQLAWNFAHILRAARQNSLDAGVGLVDMDAWANYNAAGSPRYTSALWDTGIQATTDPTSLGRTYFNNIVGLADMLWKKASDASYGQNSFFVNNAFRSTTSDSWTDMSGGTAHLAGSFFTSSDMFTIPGWRPRRNGETGATVVPDDISETSQNFVLFANNTFPEVLRWRTDLPFGPTPDSTWLAGTPLPLMQNFGYARWTRDVLQGTLTAKDDGVATILAGNVNVWSSLWMVEEPITNYQLILLDPLNNNKWPGGNLAGNIRITNSSLNNNVYRPKVLLYGTVAANLTNYLKGGWLTGRNTAANAPMSDPLPVAAVVGGSVDASVLAIAPAATEGFEWRIAKPSTRLSFGRAPGNINSSLPTQAPDLGQFLIAQMQIAPLVGDSAFERRLELNNAQSSLTPAIYTMDASMVPGQYCYLNSVLSMVGDSLNRWGVQWSVQEGNPTNNVMGSPFTLPTTPSGSGIDYWVYDSSGNIIPNNDPQNRQVKLQYGPPSNQTTAFDNINTTVTPNVDRLGLQGWHQRPVSLVSVPTASSATVITVDLSKVGVDQSTAAGNATTAAWMAPYEINIQNTDTTNNLLYVRILGDPDASPAGGGRQPVRIVVRGASEIRLVPDPTRALAGVGNFRRFILTSPDQGPMNLALETSGSSYRWYGVLIAPYGVSINSFSDFSISGGTPSLGSPQNGATLIWQGTILARQRLQVGYGSLQISPDDGLGTATLSPADSYAAATAFVPQYNNNIFLGRPVPLLVPRMVWTFE